MLFFQFVFVLLGSLMASPSSAVPTSVVQRDDAASFPELSFVDSCDRHSTAVKHFPETGKYFLRSTCQADGESHCSKIDLDNCLVNVAGALVGRPNGGFSGSCHDCKFSNDDAADEAEFKCTCESDSGPNETVIPLQDYVSNSNGWLMCYDIKGVGCYD
ncbi:hypothetical protein MGN70_000656 [Eutypa lata]|nr:hypothetical protein MGN70_000656 [Eutypa lata]